MVDAWSPDDEVGCFGFSAGLGVISTTSLGVSSLPSITMATDAKIPRHNDVGRQTDQPLSRLVPGAPFFQTSLKKLRDYR